MEVILLALFIIGIVVLQAFPVLKHNIKNILIFLLIVVVVYLVLKNKQQNELIEQYKCEKLNTPDYCQELKMERKEMEFERRMDQDSISN